MPDARMTWTGSERVQDGSRLEDFMRAISFHALGQGTLAAFVRGVVVTAIGEAGREAFHIGDATFDVVGVLVVLAVVQ